MQPCYIATMLIVFYLKMKCTSTLWEVYVPSIVNEVTLKGGYYKYNNKAYF